MSKHKEKNPLEEAWDNYYNKLIRIIGRKKVETEGYILLIRKLWHTKFIYSVPNDENRQIDAINFRENFIKSKTDMYMLYGCKGTTVNLLEVLIAFSKRIEEDVMYGVLGKGLDNTRLWFWLMLENSGLLYYSDDRFDESEVDEKIDIILNRRYNFNGSDGGLFPLKNPPTDQRNIELWFQMNAYMIEKYPD